MNLTISSIVTLTLTFAFDDPDAQIDISLPHRDVVLFANIVDAIHVSYIQSSMTSEVYYVKKLKDIFSICFELTLSLRAVEYLVENGWPDHAQIPS